MTFEEIIQKIRERDEQVTRCFFFWDGPTQSHIDSLRRTNPIKAAKMRRPICSTCRPGLLSVLHKIYGKEPFDYNSLVTSFYIYLMEGDKFSTIKSPDSLMGWIVTSAYFYFLREKSNKDKVLEKESNLYLDIEEDISDFINKKDTRIFVTKVLNAMPNRQYAKILDDVTLEAAQYSGQEKAEVIRKQAQILNIPVDNLYVKISLAKKQFKETALKLLNDHE